MVDAKILIQATVLDHFRFLCHYRVHKDIKSQNDPILEKIGKPGLKDQVLSILKNVGIKKSQHQILLTFCTPAILLTSSLLIRVGQYIFSTLLRQM